MGPNGSRRPKPEAPESARLVPARAWEEPALTIPGYAAFPIRLCCCTPGGDPGYRNPGPAGPATGANILSHSRGTATLFSPGSNGMPSRTKNRMPNWLYFGTYRNAPTKNLFSLVKPHYLWFTGLLPTRDTSTLWAGDPTPERGGHSKGFYRVTATSIPAARMPGG